MASKGGLVAVGGIGLSLLALLAFSKDAKAAPAPTGVPPISEAECEQAKANRANINQALKDVDQDIGTASSNMQAAADAGDEAQLAYWASVRSQLQGIRASVVAQRTQIDAFLEQCP